jgi:hypothetical protein
MALFACLLGTGSVTSGHVAKVSKVARKKGHLPPDTTCPLTVPGCPPEESVGFLTGAGAPAKMAESG